MGTNPLRKYPEVVWGAKLVVRDNCFLHTEEEVEAAVRCSVVTCLLQL